MRDVSHKDSAYLISGLAEGLPVDLTRICASTGDDQFGLVFTSEGTNLIVIDQSVTLFYAIPYDLVVHTGEVNWTSVREMSSLV